MLIRCFIFHSTIACVKIILLSQIYNCKSYNQIEVYNTKLSEGYLLKEITGNFVIIPVGQNIVDYKSILRINETGALIWKQLEQQKNYEEILTALAKEYEATKEELPILQADLNKFLQQMKSMGLLSDC